MSLTNIAKGCIEGCILDKKGIEKAREKIRVEDMKKYFLQAGLEEMGAIEFYLGLREKLAQLDKITPVEFVAVATDVINTLRRNAKKINITYANKYEGLEQKTGVLAMSIFPAKFYEEVLNNLN